MSKSDPDWGTGGLLSTCGNLRGHCWAQQGLFYSANQPLRSMLRGQPEGGCPGSLLGWNHKELEDKDTDVLLETWLLMTGKGQSGFWKCFKDDSVSTEVSRNDCLSTCFSRLTADPVLSRQLHDWIVNIKADRADSPSPDPASSEGESSQQEQAGDPNILQLSGSWHSQSFWLGLSLSVSFPLRLQQGPAGSRTGPQLKEASFQHVLCHPLGVGHERIQWCPGSHSFHRAEGADIAYAYSARAKPSHSSYLSQRGLGKCNLTMCLWDTTPGVFVEGVNDFCNLLSIVKRKTGSSFGH